MIDNRTNPADRPLHQWRNLTFSRLTQCSITWDNRNSQTLMASLTFPFQRHPDLDEKEIRNLCHQFCTNFLQSLRYKPEWAFWCCTKWIIFSATSWPGSSSHCWSGYWLWILPPLRNLYRPKFCPSRVAGPANIWNFCPTSTVSSRTHTKSPISGSKEFPDSAQRNHDDIARNIQRKTEQANSSKNGSTTKRTRKLHYQPKTRTFIVIPEWVYDCGQWLASPQRRKWSPGHCPHQPHTHTSHARVVPLPWFTTAEIEVIWTA